MKLPVSRVDAVNVEARLRISKGGDLLAGWLEVLLVAPRGG